MSDRAAITKRRSALQSIDRDLQRRMRATSSRVAAGYIGRSRAYIRAAIGELDIALACSLDPIVEHRATPQPVTRGEDAR